jgi:hypothetical protein
VPDRPAMGALIDPNGTSPEALTKSEYEDLRTHLLIMRSEEHDALREFMQSSTMIFGFESKAPKEKILWWLVRNYMEENCDEAVALLIPRKGHGEDIATIEDDELEPMQWTLATLRAGGWFAEWLKLQVATIADAKMAVHRYPSPLTIMGTLTEALAQFQEQTETAREIMTQRPDLFPERKEAANA